MIHISRYVETPKGFGFVKGYKSSTNTNEVLYVVAMESGTDETFNQYEVKQVGNGKKKNK